jgi:cation transport ATPase
MTEFLSIPLFDDDFYKMMFRFLLNIAFLTLIIRWLYYGATKRKDYLFTYYMIGIIVFLLCFTLKKYELDIGMALGLFAIFGIIRYRTDAVPIKEMTYLFVVIGVSVVNSLANQKMSYAEILAANSLVIIALFTIERLWFTRNVSVKIIQYEKIENIKPENAAILRQDLETRTGLKIENIKVGDIDFLKDAATITITHYN